MAIRIEILGRRHRPLLEVFRNQQASLVEYLRRYALRHAEKDLLARTFVALDDSEDELRLAGYFSLAPVSVDRAAVFLVKLDEVTPTASLGPCHPCDDSITLEPAGPKQRPPPSAALRFLAARPVGS